MAGSAHQEDLLARLRQICLGMPCSSERATNGAPTFFVQGTRAFATLTTGLHGDESVSLWLAAPEALRNRLVSESPERFYEPALVGYRDWLAVRLDDTPNWEELGALLEEAFAEVAPQELVEEARARH